MKEKINKDENIKKLSNKEIRKMIEQEVNKLIETKKEEVEIKIY